MSTPVEQIKVLSQQSDKQLSLHADAQIFTSPAPAAVARLSAEIGDCRPRVPTPDSLACLADVAPSSGPHPRPSLALRDLDLLAEPDALPPSPASGSPGAGPARTTDGLT